MYKTKKMIFFFIFHYIMFHNKISSTSLTTLNWINQKNDKKITNSTQITKWLAPKQQIIKTYVLAGIEINDFVISVRMNR